MPNPKEKQNQANRSREDIFNLLRQTLIELTDNQANDIRYDSLIFNELNLTEFDLQRIIKKIGTQIEIDIDNLLDDANREEIVTISDLIDLIVDEKDLG